MKRRKEGKEERERERRC